MCYSTSLKEKKIIDKFKLNNSHICSYCGKQITTEKDLTVDHKLPKSRGGLTEDKNLAICCKKCNTDKADMTEQEYRDYLIQVNDIKNNAESSIYIMEMINTYNKIIEEYDKIMNIINDKTKEKNELEQIIVNSNCNAAEGYNLYRDLKDMLLDIQKFEQQRNQMDAIYKHAKENATKMIQLYNEMVVNKIRELRRSRLGKKELTA